MNDGTSKNIKFTEWSKRFWICDKKFEQCHNNSNADYDVGNDIIYNTEVWKSSLGDYNDAYILVRGDTAIIGHQVTQVVFKYCAPFTKGI